MRRFFLAAALAAAFGCSTQPANDPGGIREVKPPVTEKIAGSPLEQAGIPTYPGAKVLGSATGETDSAGGQHFNSLLSTSDAPSKVEAFYKEQLKFEGAHKGGETQFVGRTPSGSDVILFLSPDGKGTKISIRGILYKK